MKKVALSVFGKATSRLLAVLALSVLLSGCAVVGPLLSLGGAIGLAPLQYASTVYTIGEFTYQYAANDKTPAQVIREKIDSVVSGDAFKVPEYMNDEPAGPEPAVMVAEAETGADIQDPALSEELRQKRIENLLGKRRVQFERLELRRMAFLQAQTDSKAEPPSDRHGGQPRSLYRGQGRGLSGLVEGILKKTVHGQKAVHRFFLRFIPASGSSPCRIWRTAPGPRSGSGWWRTSGRT